MLRERVQTRARLPVRRWHVVMVGMVAAVGAGAVTVPRLFSSPEDNGPMMVEVSRGEFRHVITERGSVESSSNTEVVCEVKSRSAAGTKILRIVPEGARVRKGDFLVELDASALEDERDQQLIVCYNSEAAKTQAKNAYDTAVAALEEYLNGEYVLAEQRIQSDMLVAEENAARAKDYREYSEMLNRKGYVTDLQLAGDVFAEEKYANDFSAALKELEVLQRYTRAKQVNQLKAEIKTAKAKYDAAAKSYELDIKRLDEIEEQIKLCTIIAPDDGQVVYANETDRRGGAEIIIEPGALVRERQVIVRLPDPSKMQVKARIKEAKIALVEAGQPVAIRLPAFAGAVLYGTVEEVSEYPAPTHWFAGNIKEYETFIRIHDPPPGLKPGLTAEVTIFVQQQTDVLQIPVEAVLEHRGHYYCIVRKGDFWVAREVKLGSSNEKHVIVSEGLEEGKKIVANASAMRDQIELPDVAPIVERPKTLGRSAAKKQPQSSQMIDGLLSRFDKNQSGRIELDELPEQMRSRMKQADTNGDGALDRSELAAAAAKYAAAGGPGQGPPGGGPGQGTPGDGQSPPRGSRSGDRP